MIQSILIWLVAVQAGLLAGLWLAWRESQRNLKLLWEEKEQLRSEQRALTEALVRADGKPLVFGRSAVKPSAGWFDGKAKVERVVATS